MDIGWMQAGPSIAAAFFASLVEFVEALTIVLAVGAMRGWRGAIGGSFAALVTLVVLAASLGPALIQIPLGLVRLGLGVLLLLFGMRWLRKAILRASGVIALRDESAAYARERSALAGMDRPVGDWDGIAIATSFQITMIEGIEVVFIVIAVGAAGGGLLLPATLGALAALLVVVLLGAVLHRPIAMLPENMLKFVVGILLCGFGTVWTGEGMGLQWPGGDWSILALDAGFLVAALMAVAICRAQGQTAAANRA